MLVRPRNTVYIYVCVYRFLMSLLDLPFICAPLVPFVISESLCDPSLLYSANSATIRY